MYVAATDPPEAGTVMDPDWVTESPALELQTYRVPVGPPTGEDQA